MSNTPKEPTSYRLSAEAKALLAALARYYGTSQTAVIEMLVRDRARREKVKAKED